MLSGTISVLRTISVFHTICDAFALSQCYFHKGTNSRLNYIQSIKWYSGQNAVLVRRILVLSFSPQIALHFSFSKKIT